MNLQDTRKLNVLQLTISKLDSIILLTKRENELNNLKLACLPKYPSRRKQFEEKWPSTTAQSRAQSHAHMYTLQTSLLHCFTGPCGRSSGASTGSTCREKHARKRHTSRTGLRRFRAHALCDISRTSPLPTSCRIRHTRVASLWQRYAPCRSERWLLIGRWTSCSRSDTGCLDVRSVQTETNLFYLCCCARNYTDVLR